MKRSICARVLRTLAVVGLVLGLVAAETGSSHKEPAAIRKKAAKLNKDGNYKEAYDLYRQLSLNPENDMTLVGSDLQSAVYCLRRINRVKETDELREEAAKIHAKSWRGLWAVAESYFNANHYGYIIGGEFERGHHRGGGKYANSVERDRVRALQLMEQAIKLSADKAEHNDFGQLHLRFANIVMGYRGYHEAWRLQYLTDISELPDYDEGYSHGYYGRGSAPSGAPVNPDGTPVYHYIPQSYEEAKTDGERWRWMLIQAMEYMPGRSAEIRMQFAQFLKSQFGVQTMAHYGSWFGRQTSDDDMSGTYALHTLGEDETIARLATGVKRFKLPGEFNFIKILKSISSEPGSYSSNASRQLASLFEDRRQYDRAVEFWKKVQDQRRIDQIVNSWGMFEPLMTQSEGKGATVEYKFRNGTKVDFTAQRIEVPELLADIKKYLKSNPRKTDHNRLNIHNIGYRIVMKNEDKFVGKEVADWSLDLEPRKRHFDKRVTVTTPLKKAGAYLLTAKMQDGNTSKIIIWVNDTVIVQKKMEDKEYFFVADAVTGKPIANADLEFFGYRHESTDWEKVLGRRYNVKTKSFTKATGKTGDLTVGKDEFSHDHQWLITATASRGRLAYLGFTSVWYGRRHDREYKAVRAFAITDRPVYRPDQPVKFKFWVRHAQYDMKDISTYANQHFSVEVRNPKGKVVFSKSYKADEFGGIDGEYALPGDTTLGIYHVNIPGRGGLSFRVEEYKKPEFEVKVEAPEEPVALGDKITATIEAKYYFGAPVTKGTVKYKVLRSNHTERWYPWAPWDWLYGSGYWWFSYDYDWYPGWSRWGCIRPHWWWWPQRHTPPEVVAEAEMPISKDGKLEVEIDTSLAKEMHGDLDHRYEITVEVTDESRRTIVGKGTVLAARKPFKVHAWVDRGHYRAGDTVRASFSARTLDNKPVNGKGELVLYSVTYKDGKPVEKAVEEWDLPTDDQGTSEIQIKAAREGQYRLSYKVTDAKDHVIEGGYVFCVRGKGFDGGDFRFNHLELVPDKRDYAPGETVRLMINTDRKGGTVALFLRPSSGVYLPPKIIRMKGKSHVEEIEISKKDMPNFFVEAFTISDGKLHSESREIVVPPEKRVTNVEVLPSAEKYRPGEEATIKVRLTDIDGNPFVGAVSMSVYDRAVEYISGGSNVKEIKAFFWKWRRHHREQTVSSLSRWFHNLIPKGQTRMNNLGAFGHLVADMQLGNSVDGLSMQRGETETLSFGGRAQRSVSAKMSAAPMMASVASDEMVMAEGAAKGAGADAGGGAEEVAPTVRTKFADTAHWAPGLVTDSNGVTKVTFMMPENLTGWKIRTWAMGHGTRVGQGEAEVVTFKNLLLRMQAPRFFVEKDEVVLSANIHNYLDSGKSVRAVLEIDGKCLAPLTEPTVTVNVGANGEERVDWRVKVMREGQAVIRMKALTDEESDAMEMKFPVYVHGMLKMDSFSGVLRPDETKGIFEVMVPAERRIDESRLEIRYSPTLAGAVVDAIPYLAEYPYGCTEQTLNRFVPTVIAQKLLMEMGVDLDEIKKKQTNLNAQEIGDDRERAKQWKHWNRNPVFDKDVVDDMVHRGIRRLAGMQLSDGGWGWFSGYHEHSYPHTTAVVVHGLQVARDNDMRVPDNMIKRGIAWLKNYQDSQVRAIELYKKTDGKKGKKFADNLDAMVHMVLVDENVKNDDMLGYLYRDRNHLSVYAKAMFGLALHRLEETEKRDMLLRNIEQYVVEDDENQSAWLNLGNGGYWWYWYGSEMEAHAYYLKLLSKVDPKGRRASRLVKYLLNNRKHATYWNSTRDTALCIEAMADYMRTSGEDKPDMTVEIFIDGKKHKEVVINEDNMFSFDNKLVLTGDAVETGAHKIEFRKKGTGPLYYNAYLTNFTLEDFIKKAGLEVKVNRKYYKLVEVDKKIKVAGSHGQALDQKVQKHERVPLDNNATLKSGDLVEIELLVESKNDYEYIIFEDMKAAGFEPVQIRSGYNANDMGAYVEFRDEKVCFFVRLLHRGKHSVSYQMRAEIPGKFSALPTKAYAMYAPELKGNSDEIKLSIVD